MLLQEQQVALELLQPPLRVHMVDLGEDLPDVGIILVGAVLIADFAVLVCGHGEGQGSV